uniref:FkbM family methyltransferase n=1 Tax=Haloquadratum walsbyi TaxID=293091 RepID=UPI0023F0840A
VYNQTLGRFVTNDMKQKYITPYYYMCMNYIAGNDQIRFDGEVIRCAGFESESIKYQLSAEEKALLDFLDEIEEDDIFFDIGAHIGIYSIIASRKSKEIHSFEPHGGNYVRLNENIQKNSIDTIFTHNVALGNETKSARGMSGGGRYLKSQIQRIRQMQEFGLKTGMNTENEWISPYQVS